MPEDNEDKDGFNLFAAEIPRGGLTEHSEVEEAVEEKPPASPTAAKSPAAPRVRHVEVTMVPAKVSP